MSNTNSIGSFLAALRKANGLTQKQLAEKLNVSDKAVSRWERDECAPDLSLIPVIAEIFGITSDELLRGQRAAPDAVPTLQTEEKSKKRLQYLLKQIQTRYKVQSLISVGIAVLGVIAAMILNAFNRAQAGFLVSCIFFLAATVCQIIFLTVSKSHLNEEEFDEAAVTACRHAIIKGAEWVFGIIAILTFATAPLMLANDPFWGLTVPYWWTNGLVFALIPAILTPIVCRIINRRLGIAKPLSTKAKLQLKSVGILAIVLMVTILAHLLAASLLYDNMHLYSPGTKFDTFEDFKAYMETPLSPDGEPLTLLESYTLLDGTTEYIYTDSNGDYYYVYHTRLNYEDPETGFYNANKNVCYITHPADTIYAYTLDQYSDAETSFILINLLIALIYPAEIAVTILIYRRKSKVTQK